MLRLALFAWLALSLVLGAALLALHEPLPLPAGDRVMATGRWTIVHALDLRCPCSRRVLEYLQKRTQRVDADQLLLLVHADEGTAAPLVARGFHVELVDELALSDRHGIASVPSLLIARPDGRVVYRGAPQERPQMAPIDLALYARARAGESLSPLPIIGCAVSHELQRRLDPLGLKYTGGN